MSPIYEATITRIDPQVPHAIIETPDGNTRIFRRATNFLKEGQRGVLTVKSETDFVFQPYRDQRLRRAPQHDLRRGEEDWLWCWTIEGTDRQFLLKPHFVPGVDGRHIDDETDAIELDVPAEFSEFCGSRGLNAEEVLRGFIADLCGLQSSVANPREDGFCSNGGDERRIAAEWFDRAYPQKLFSPRADEGE